MILTSSYIDVNSDLQRKYMTPGTSLGQRQSCRMQAGLIGAGIQSSRSPFLHRDEAAALGLTLDYELFDLDQISEGAAALPRLLDQAEHAGFVGLNVTHPCKQLVIDHLDELSPEARALGAVNTVIFSDRGRVGYNTDWWGFSESFKRGLPGVACKQVLQLGAGGAGAAVAFAMLRMNTGHLKIYDISTDKAEQLSATLRTSFDTLRIEAVTNPLVAGENCDGLINTTPIGMDKYPGLPMPAELLRANLWVAEIIYFPLETMLLREARRRGCRTVDGGGMVVFQAAEAFRLFTGVDPNAQRMLQRFRRDIAAGMVSTDA